MCVTTRGGSYYSPQFRRQLKIREFSKLLKAQSGWRSCVSQDSASSSNALIIKPVTHAFDILLAVSGSLAKDSTFMISLEVRLRMQIPGREKAQLTNFW